MISPDQPSDPRRARGEGGVALVTIMLLCLILIMLSIASVGYALGSQTLSKRDENWNAALAAANAGVDDYIFRLNQNSNYYQYSKTNLPPDGNGAFLGWVSVPGNASTAQYRYSADATRIAVDGTIALTSTGNVSGVMRTVRATLRRRSFLDYLYFTDYETLDPASYTGSPYTAAQAQVTCVKHYYEGRNANCIQIQFIGQDNINGPLHSNDAILICGNAHFNGDTSTSWTGVSGVRWRDGCPTSHPAFATSTDPRYLPPLTMPPSNSALRAEVGVGKGGCLYTGPTSVVLNGNGTMTVVSKFSKKMHNNPAISGDCPTNGSGPVPQNGVIYVQNVPSSSTDENYTSTTVSGGCPYNVNGRAHPLGYPVANDVTTYGCRNGDVFLEGTLKGQLTVASENNIDLTWNVKYNSGVAGSDLLGLVANNYVEIYHPVNSSGTNLNAGPNHSTSTFQSPIIQAAILSVNHSFRVQNYAQGATLGTLNITGAIAQRYRGPVGTNSGGTIQSGYAKNYTYDQRLKYLSPPKFLDPVASAWGTATWAEIQNPTFP